jgi:hypothetical protein
VTPKALDANADYRVTDPFGAGDPAIVAGADLMTEGLPAPASDGRMASWVRVIERV